MFDKRFQILHPQIHVSVNILMDTSQSEVSWIAANIKCNINTGKISASLKDEIPSLRRGAFKQSHTGKETLRNLPPMARYSTKVKCLNELQTQRKRETLKCYNTYISIIISFRKTPSARSVIDSIKALVLKVLLACINEKNG